MQAFPFISSFTRFSSSDAAMPFGCLSVLVTWLNLMTISPGWQASDACAAPADRASAPSAQAVTNSFFI